MLIIVIYLVYSGKGAIEVETVRSWPVQPNLT